MTSQGQFTHPLVVRAKLEIASACHAHGKVPSHCVVTEFNDMAAMRAAAQRAAQELGCTRMWSIHPSQIRPILEAMSPDTAAIEVATEIVLAAYAAQWAPISHQGHLQDRASYRFYWQLLERAHSTGCSLPAEVQLFFKD
jgi:citrate lyase subunit beta/citryl-CoA lyase